MKTAIVVACLVLLTWFTWNIVLGNRMSPTEKVSYEITDMFVKIGRSKFGLSTYGTGGGVQEKINILSIHFTHHGKMTLEEARHLIIDITHDFLNELDKNKKYEKYLHEKPMRIKTLRISVAFENEETARKTGLRFVRIDKGEVWYTIYDPNDPEQLQTKIFLSEPFEEAERIVAEQRAAAAASNILQSPQ